MTTYADHLAEVETILALLEEHAERATALADTAPPAEVRPHFASLAAGIAKARTQLNFVVNLLTAHEAPAHDHRQN